MFHNVTATSPGLMENRFSMKSPPFRALGLGLLVVGLLGFSACGASDDGEGPETYRSFVYVANYHSADISAFLVDDRTGALTAVAGSPFDAADCLSFITVHPSGQLAYVIHASPDLFSDQISGYSIDASTGALRRLAGSPFVTGTPSFDKFASISFDPSGKFAYVANGTMDNIAAYSVDTTTGALTAIAGSPFAAGGGPVSTAVDPSGRFVYAANYRSYEVSAYSIDAVTGALTEIAGSPFWLEPGGPSDITIDPSGRFVFVAIFDTDLLKAFSIDASTGALTEAVGSPFGGVSSPTSIAIDPSGQHIYVSNQRTDDVTAYFINTVTGALSERPSSPFATGDHPVSIAIEPSGKYVYVVNMYGGNVSAFSIQTSTGDLLAVPGSPYALGMTPMSVAVVRIVQ
jgi:6-phosphogluconolactonase (cycloisomerase 2 family)